MKHFFNEPLFEVISFMAEDILSTSPGDFDDNTGPFEGEEDVFGPGDYTPNSNTF